MFTSMPFDHDSQLNLKFLGCYVLEVGVLWTQLHPFYLEKIKSKKELILAQEHHELCLKYGLGYIGPEWHYIHYGKKYYHACSDPTVRAIFVERNTLAILVHLMAISFCNVQSCVLVPTKRQALLRKAIFDGFVNGLHEKAHNLEEPSKGFCHKQLPRGCGDQPFVNFFLSSDYDEVIEYLMFVRCVCGVSEDELRDQFLFDCYQIWERHNRISFAYSQKDFESY